LGAPKAITATAHKLARIVYNLVRYGGEYVKTSEAEYTELMRERLERQLKRRAKELGFEVTKKAEQKVTARCQCHQATDTERVGDNNHMEEPLDPASHRRSPARGRRFYEGVCDEGDGLSGVAKGPEKSGEATVTRHPPQRKFLGRRVFHSPCNNLTSFAVGANQPRSSTCINPPCSAASEDK
jgi:hypothetical protein